MEDEIKEIIEVVLYDRFAAHEVQADKQAVKDITNVLYSNLWEYIKDYD